MSDAKMIPAALPDTKTLLQRALEKQTVIPGFNIPYLPMMEPVVRALRDCDSVGLIMVARLEIVKFSSGSLKAIRDEFRKVGDPAYTRLHLDHMPVIDEDHLKVDYLGEIHEALDLGYESVMIDGSRLPLEGNIAATAAVTKLAGEYRVPVEAELGAVMGHEAGVLPPYEELFRTRRGFTDIAEAEKFVRETKTDFLSVAVGSIHGAISAAGRVKQKPRARIDLEHLAALENATKIPLVLHGGTGIDPECVRASFARGIAKINVATAIRQVYERDLTQGIGVAQESVYQTMCALLREEYRLEHSRALLMA
ncbi:MAG: class II fructose-bisphosphate aldolase [Victivallaceae bacterium]|nr:class II fructose-bisphosphate aldolase [Victivallaceae bacterium]